jgi:hypothetical protein
MALLRGFLYIIADKGRQFVKIGTSRDVNSRFYQISVTSPLDLELVGFYPCTYARFRENRVHMLLKDLSLRHEWFRWDEARVQAAVEKVLAIPDEDVKLELKTFPQKSYDYPVKRVDTGEVFPTARIAALTVLGSKRLATKIKRAVKDGVKCGPTYWAKVEGES